MKNYKKIIGLVLAISPLGVIVAAVGVLHGMGWLLADAVGLLFAVVTLIGVYLLVEVKK
jgi:hypothetical protein